MADRALHARAPLAGFALPGRFGAASGKPGLVIEERTDLALATGRRAAPEESRSLNLPLPRPTVLTYPTVRALRLVADQSAAEFGYEMLQLNRPGTRHVV
jgi:hypothetical protein